MKKRSKIAVALLITSLLLSLVFVSISSAATPLQSLSAGTRNGGYFDFDGYSTGSTSFDASATQKYYGTVVGTYGRLYSNAGWKNDAIIKVAEHSVDGATNKYLSFVADPNSTTTYTSDQSYGIAPETTFAMTDTDGKRNDFIVLDLDIRADKYVVSNSDGSEATFYSSWDEVVLAGKESEAKLAYPEKLKFSIDPAYSSYYMPSFIISKAVETEEGTRYKSYLSFYSSTSASYGQMELSDKVGEWNHITVLYDVRAVSEKSVGTYVYLDGKYVGSYIRTGGATSYTAKEFKIFLPYAEINKTASTYAFGIDNWTVNGYLDYNSAESVKNSIVDVENFKKDYALYDCDDVVYNRNYLSPNGNSFSLCWTDLEGNELLNEKISIGKTPEVNAALLSESLLTKVKGDFGSLSAWEWNIGGDKDVFTPVAELTRDMVKAVRARGEYKVTLRPATERVYVYAPDKTTLLGEDLYYAGSTVSTLSSSSNGWYRAEYTVAENFTEGEDASSYKLVSGKKNCFTVDEKTASPTASVTGILCNMSLLTNYYMNVYIPAETPDGVSVDGMFGDEALTLQYSGVRRVVYNGVAYYQLSFEIANSDIDKTLSSFVKMTVSIGESEYELSYRIDINMLSYCRAVIDSYGCESEECSLVLNLLRYASEAYNFDRGSYNAAAEEIIDAHRSCSCLLDTDVTNEYKGDSSGLSEYVYGLSYSVNSQEPGVLVFIYKDKAAAVSGIVTDYSGFNGAVSGEFVNIGETSFDGVAVLTYMYVGISASDISKVMKITVNSADAILASGTYSLANYVYESNNTIAASLYAFGKSAYNYKKSVYIPEDSGEVIEGITVEKNSTLLPSMTVNPGSTVGYTLTVKNNTESALTVPIYDSIPANTSYVSGDALVSGYELYFEVTVGAGESVSVGYTVKVDNDKKLIGGALISPPVALIGGNPASCHGNYVELTMNSYDAEFIKLAVAAHRYSGFTDTSMAKWIYQIAFTKNFTMSTDTSSVLGGIFGDDTAESASHRRMVVPTLFGGTLVDSSADSRFRGERSKITLEDLIAGDFILFEDENGAKIFIFDGEELISLTEGYEHANETHVIASANAAWRYAVLRPSIVMTSLSHPESVDDASELTAKQKALIETAKAYFLRGYRLQYDDTRFDSAISGADSEYRWQIGQRAPEDYTCDEWGYINCAGFTYDVYLNSLGYDLKDLYTTSNLVWQYTTSSYARVEWDGVFGKLKTTYNGANLDYKMYPFFYLATHEETPETAALVEERFMSELQVGDLIVIRRNIYTSASDTGHVMMYIGNGKVVHSTGSSFSYSSDPAKETYEPTIRYMNIRDYLFNSTSTNYIFDSDSKVDQLGIVRPFASSSFKGSVSANTQNRIDSLDGIVAEKLSSHKEGATVSIGETVTYAFRLFNYSGAEKTVSITDTVPENSELVLTSGGSADGDSLTFTVTVGAGETVEVYYTVRATGAEGSYIESRDAKIGGVSHNCPKVYIKRTLSSDEQAAIIDAIELYQSENPDSLSGLALANAIYVKAGLAAPFDTDSVDSVRDEIFEAVTTSNKNSRYQLKADGKYTVMVAPTLYGGERLHTPQQYTKNTKVNSDRTRLAFEHDLVIGDILYARYSSGYTLYIYAGADMGFVNLSTLAPQTKSVDDVLVTVMGYYYYYAVLRPSFTFATA